MYRVQVLLPVGLPLKIIKKKRSDLSIYDYNNDIFRLFLTESIQRENQRRQNLTFFGEILIKSTYIWQMQKKKDVCA